MTLTQLEVPVNAVDKSKAIRGVYQPTLTKLLASLKQDGQLADILVMKTKEGLYVLIDGLHRLAAAEQLGWKTIRAKVYEDLSNEDFAVMALTANIARKSMDKIALATAYMQAMKMGGLSPTQLAKRLGQEVSTITRTLELKKLTPALQAKVSSGELAYSVGAELAKVPPEKQEALYAEIAKLPRDEAIHVIKRTLKGGKPKTKKVVAKVGGLFLTIATTNIHDLIGDLSKLKKALEKINADGLPLTVLQNLLDNQQPKTA